jgi:type I phosphodiesterase/nucleotide pyrophosphatase
VDDPSAQPHLADLLPSVLAALRRDPASDVLELASATGKIRQAALVLIDGLGFHLLPEAAASSPELADLLAARHTTVRRLQAPFPSTTPTSLVTLGTGRLPGAHGVLGFTVRVPGTDRVLTHITWRDDPAQQWQPEPRLLGEAARQGLSTVTVSDPAYAGSGLTRAAYGAARYRGTKPGRTSADAIATELADGTALVYGYHAALDTAAHRHGIDSRQWRAEARRVGTFLTRIADRLPAGAALIVTADHGGLDVPPQARFDIDTDQRLAAGVELVAGEPRVRYLHVADGAAEDVAAAYRAVLGPTADVYHRDELIELGWFGPVPPAHRERIGDLVVVCREPVVVLATQHEPPAVATLVGFHGAATPVETEIPLLVVAPG